MKQFMKSHFFVLTIIYSCNNNSYMAEFEQNTEKAKSIFKLHEEENADAMFEYLHPDINWHMPLYGMNMGEKKMLKLQFLDIKQIFDNKI